LLVTKFHSRIQAETGFSPYRNNPLLRANSGIFLPKKTLRSRLHPWERKSVCSTVRIYAFALAAIFLAFLDLPNCFGFLRVLPEVPLLIFPRLLR